MKTRRLTVRLAIAGVTSIVGVTSLAGVAGAVERRVADVAVSVSAARHVLPLDGWTIVIASVSNIGTRPAANVRRTVTLPPTLRISGTTTSDEWACTQEMQVVTCDLLTDLVPGHQPYPLSISAYPVDASVGLTEDVIATVSTTSREKTTSNNQAAQAITYVDKGVVRGQLWHDLDADGVREDGEPPIISEGIDIRSIDDEDQYGHSNTHDGTFYFQVPAKSYVASETVSKSWWRFTAPNVGSDATDSDLVPISETTWSITAESALFTITAGEETIVDIGLVAVTPST